MATLLGSGSGIVRLGTWMWDQLEQDSGTGIFGRRILRKKLCKMCGILIEERLIGEMNVEMKLIPG